MYSKTLPQCGSVFIRLAVVLVLVVILVVVLVLVAVLAIVLVVVLIVILITILVIHILFLRYSLLRTCRYSSMPGISGFILGFEKYRC